jgi:hypothetical protein
MNRCVRLGLCLVFLLSACSTLKPGSPGIPATAEAASPPAPDTPAASQPTAPPATPAPLSMASSSDSIRQKIQASSSAWQTIFVDGTITWPGPNGSSAPAQVWHEQDWIERSTQHFRVLLGPPDGAATTFKACDGTSILSIDLKTGQSQSNPLPQFAQDPAPVAGQDMLWGQIGTPLSEIALSANYGASGGQFVPVRLDKVAGRPALVVDWLSDGASLPAFRAWLDVETGVILELQEFAKGGGDKLQGERLVNQVIYDAPFADSLFGVQAAMPQFSDISGYPLTPASPLPTPSGQADPLGQVYFFVMGQASGNAAIRLERLPGSCVSGKSACPPPEQIDTPFPLDFSLNPLAWSPDGKTAAFNFPNAANGTKTDLFLFDPGKLAWTALVEFNYIDPPLWSPDGNLLAFRVQDGQGSDDTYAIRRDGNGLINLSASAQLPADQRPYIADGWLADGLVMHSALPGTPGSLYLVRPQDASARPLFKTLLTKSQFFPSPDGKRLAYFDYSDTSPRHVLKLVDLNGTTVRELFVFRDGSIYPLLWSPDDTRIAFVFYTNNPENGQDVYLVNPDGTGLSQVYHSQRLGSLAFSPDGKALLIQSDEAAGQHLFVVDLATLEQHLLQAPGLPLDSAWLMPSWQP